MFCCIIVDIYMLPISFVYKLRLDLLRLFLKIIGYI